MSEVPLQPEQTLDAEDLQRFIYACSHERRSPTTQRLIDAASYGWIHMFIRSRADDAPPSKPGESWLDSHDADPAKLAGYFGRVAIRLRTTGAREYAKSLESYFLAMAEKLQMPWPPKG